MSSDWVPAAFRDSDDPERAAELAVDEANRMFSDLGVSASVQPGARATPAAQVPCAGCGKQVTGRVLEAMDRAWHPDCFVCDLCNRPFAETGAGFQPRGDKAVCAKCVQWEKKERGGGGGGGGAAAPAPAPASGAGAASEASEAADAHRRAQAGKEACAKCGRAVAGFGVEEESGVYHVDCWTCAGCGATIGAEEYVKVGGRPYHRPCAQKEHGTSCTGCGKAIEGKFVRAEGKPYHKACFVCAACAGALAGGYVMRQGAPLCGGCVAKGAAAPAPAPAPVPAPQAGIRVDPRTGEVRAAAAPKKFCTECGNGLVAGARFCGECGNRLAA